MLVANEHSPVAFLLTIGGILLLGLFTSTLAERTFLPRATLLLLFGVLIGGQGLNLIPSPVTTQFEIIADMTLLMVGFLIGGKLTIHSLRQNMGEVLWLSVAASVVPALLVGLLLFVFSLPLPVAMLLGCIAAATDATAVLDVVSESGYKGKFSRALLSIVALDDIWALVLFAFGMAVVSSLNGEAHNGFFAEVGWELGGSMVLGMMIGIPAAYITGRVKDGEPMLAEALGLVFICGGLAIWFEVSHLIAAMTMGAVIVNLARHHDYPFHAIEGIESLFIMLFFVLAGASLEFDALMSIGWLGTLYVLGRSAGKLLGATMGARLAGMDSLSRRWTGPALLPQAGVAIGMALVAANQFPQYRQTILTLVISSTILFEIIGPVFTRLAIRRVEKNEGDNAP
ncbi:cation:proton antiporter [Bowmanella dokdonensis]|uniref:Cation:proton antiporter n=2 Tax=Bowmanella dokdonensis TaxID=751969 RepID=A0A939DMM9_9ALTE|nr:cation:proton antiporter [Bowmanella dokdonensis]